MEYTTCINYHWAHILVGFTGNCQMCPCANAALTPVSSTNKNLPPHNKKKILLKVALNTITLTRNIRILSTYHRCCLVSIKIYKKRSSIYSVLIKYSCLKIEKTKVKMSSHVVLDNIQLSKNRQKKSKMSSHVASIEISIRDVS